MKIAYITANTPFGSQETFVLTEMLALKKLGANIIVIPRDKPHKLFHKKAETLLKDTLIVPRFNIEIAITSLIFFISKPVLLLKLINDIVFKARNIKIALKNMFFLPKALYLSKILKKIPISHIHAHWASTTSTIAYIISKITEIPWSFTCHRWDIIENNLLKLKVESASFTRCISKHGKKMLLDIIGHGYEHKIKILHMGVELIGSTNFTMRRNNSFVVAVPANLYPVKGHKYLIDACFMLKKKDLGNLNCIFYGDGYLKKELKEYIRERGLSDFINMPGRIPNEELINLYQNRKIDAVVLPSINTDDGEHEGIPVGLMEAMSYGIPVISTNTGGIPELIDDGSGIMVREKDSEAIAGAIEKLMVDSIYYNDMAEKGRLKVKTHFNVDTIAKGLINLFSADTKLSHQQKESSSSTVWDSKNS